MRILLAVALLALSSASGSAAEKNRRYVSADIRGTFRDRWDISDHQGKLWMNVSTFGNSVNFSGRPISGSVWGGGNSWSISGGSVSGTVSKFGNSLSVRATIHGPRGSRWVNFELYAMGPMDDPNRAPSLSLSGMDANLNFSPSFNRDYSVSGTVDDERFGEEGLAIACLAAALVLKDRPQTAAIPGKDFLNKSAVVTPFLKTGFSR